MGASLGESDEMLMAAMRNDVMQLPLATRANPLEEMLAAGQLSVVRPGGYDTCAFLFKGEAMSAAEAWGNGGEA